MASSTGFAALAETSRDAALAFVAREEELARLKAAVAARDVEATAAEARATAAEAHAIALHQALGLELDAATRDGREIRRLEGELAATRAELAEVRLELAGARAAAVPVPE